MTGSVDVRMRSQTAVKRVKIMRVGESEHIIRTDKVT